MQVDGRDGDLRLLAVFCNPEEEDPGYDPPGPGSTPKFVASRPGAKVGRHSHVLHPLLHAAAFRKDVVPMHSFAAIHHPVQRKSHASMLRDQQGLLCSTAGKRCQHRVALQYDPCMHLPCRILYRPRITRFHQPGGGHGGTEHGRVGCKAGGVQADDAVCSRLARRPLGQCEGALSTHLHCQWARYDQVVWADITLINMHVSLSRSGNHWAAA